MWKVDPLKHLTRKMPVTKLNKGIEIGIFHIFFYVKFMFLCFSYPVRISFDFDLTYYLLNGNYVV